MSSAGYNRVTLLGNLGSDPELKYTSTNQAILKFRVATTEKYLAKDGSPKEKTEWHSIVLWGNRGEALAKILKKGTRVFIEGKLSTSSYTAQNETNKRYRTEIVVLDIILNSVLRSDGGGGGGGQISPPEPAEDFGDYAGPDDSDIPF